MTIVDVSQLQVRKNNIDILKGLSFKIPEGQITAIVGPNGAGKTTLLESIVGVEKNFEGEVLYNSQNLKNMNSKSRAEVIAWVPESTTIPFSFTALEIVLMGSFPKHQGLPDYKDIEIAKSALSSVGLSDRQAQKITSMSAGERKKVLIARSLASDTKMIFFDEPIANLDISSSFEIMSIFKRLTTSGKTIVLSIHDLGLAAHFASHCILLKAGVIKEHGPATQILNSENIMEVFGVNAKFIDIEDQKRLLISYPNIDTPTEK